MHRRDRVADHVVRAMEDEHLPRAAGASTRVGSVHVGEEGQATAMPRCLAITRKNWDPCARDGKQIDLGAPWALGCGGRPAPPPCPTQMLGAPSRRSTQRCHVPSAQIAATASAHGVAGVGSGGRVGGSRVRIIATGSGHTTQPPMHAMTRCAGVWVLRSARALPLR